MSHSPASLPLPTREHEHGAGPDESRRRASQGGQGRGGRPGIRSDRLDPARYAHARFNLSRAYETLDRLGDAQGAALRAILLRPDEVRSRLQLGIILLRAGRLESASEVYRRALRMDPAHAEARSRLWEIEQLTAR